MPFTRTSPHFGWVRYWLPRAEPLDLSGGFLPDPEDDFDRFRNPALCTLDSLQESPVLVLLGDPGMGKTTALADEAKRLRVAVKIVALAEGLSPIVLIIETKGCWNGELMTAMQSQLKERYLRPLGPGHGLYLVGWYACEFWQGQDDKRCRCERAAIDPADLQAKLSTFAVSHSDQEFRLRAFVLDVRHPA